MARSRNIKPGFFVDDELAELPALTRLLFIGLWCIADREGRLEDRPKKIKAEVMPYDDIDIDSALFSLSPLFLTRYTVDGKKYIQINNFIKHQQPHIKEAASTIPPPCDEHHASTIQAPCLYQTSTIKKPLIPDSLNLIPDSIEKHLPTSDAAGVTGGTPLEPAEPRTGPERSGAKSKKRKPSDSAHAWFSHWFSWAFEQITDGATYAYTQADGAIIKRLLASLKPPELVSRATVYLLLPDEKRFPRGSPTLKGLAGMINQIPGLDTDDTDRRAVTLGILPEPGVSLNAFTPWRDDSQQPRNLRVAA